MILNELRHSYVQDLQQAIERTARAFGWRPVEGEDRGGVSRWPWTPSAMPKRILLLSLARVVLNPAQGSLLELLYRPRHHPLGGTARPSSIWRSHLGCTDEPADSSRQKLEFFNGWGGFDAGWPRIRDCRSPTHPIRLRPGAMCIANEHFGSVVTERGAMCTWSMNSRENQLTAWSNDRGLRPFRRSLLPT